MVPVPVPATCFTRQFRTVHGRGRRSSMLVVLTTARSDPVAMNRAAGALPVSITPKLISWVPTPNHPEAPPESPEPDSFTNSVVATPPDGLQQSDPATAATCVAGPAASVTSAICVPGPADPESVMPLLLGGRMTDAVVPPTSRLSPVY